MKFLFFFIFALLAMFVGAEENCEDIPCPYILTPVCAQADGTLPLTLGNECAVRHYSCTQKKGENFWSSLTNWNFNIFNFWNSQHTKSSTKENASFRLQLQHKLKLRSLSVKNKLLCTNKTEIKKKKWNRIFSSCLICQFENDVTVSWPWYFIINIVNITKFNSKFFVWHNFMTKWCKNYSKESNLEFNSKHLSECHNEELRMSTRYK